MMHVIVQGTYSLGNQTTCTDCPPGYACPSICTDDKKRCEAGTYSAGKQTVRHNINRYVYLSFIWSVTKSKKVSECLSMKITSDAIIPLDVGYSEVSLRIYSITYTRIRIVYG